MQIPNPLPLVRQAAPFDDRDWIFEIKHDGFRCLAVIEHRQCRLFSRKKHRLTGFRDLREALVREVNAERAIVDGELVVTDRLGRRSSPPAFDLLRLDCEDLRGLPLVERKRKLKRILPSRRHMCSTSITREVTAQNCIA